MRSRSSTSIGSQNFRTTEERFITAAELRKSAEFAAQDMFKTGNLDDFLRILSRLDHYDAYNLMLILQQFPKATCLAGFKVWQRLLGDTNATVLKPEWKGKGIDLLIPYTDPMDLTHIRLRWISVKQFDVSQTYVKVPPASPSYILDEYHLPALVESVARTIRMEYHRTVYAIGSDGAMKACGLPGRMTANVIAVREDLSSIKKLRWLTECLSQLQDGANVFDPFVQDLFHQCILYTFWLSWRLETPPSLYPFRNQIRTLPKEQQMAFLSALQRSFRLLRESISAAYIQSREELESEEDLKVLDEESIPRPPHMTDPSNH